MFLLKEKKDKFNSNNEIKNAKQIAFSNQKGGVGKTTCCVNVAAAMAMRGKKVLLIDMDPQGNATMGSGVDKNLIDCTINEVLLETDDLNHAIIENVPGGYDLLPSNGGLTASEVSLLSVDQREYKLKNALMSVQDKYDYVLFDCPPSLNILTLNALVAAHAVIVPMQCEYYALEGLSALMNTIESVQRQVNQNLTIEGIILTMYDNRNKLSTDVEQQVKKHFKDKVYKTVIPRNIRLAEAPSHGLPVILYDKSSKGAKAYISLVAEMLKGL